MAETAPGFLKEIISGLPPGWTEGDLQDAFLEANLTPAEKQQLAEYLGVQPGDDPLQVFSALMSLLTEG